LSDLYVCSSRNEGCPNALLEAMALGKAVLVSLYNNSVFDIIEHHNNGVVFENENYEDMAEKAIYLLNDKQYMSMLGRNAKKTINDNHNINKIGKQYERFLF
jgi:glycosyltransferase involved in cell wall biosynthesis